MFAITIAIAAPGRTAGRKHDSADDRLVFIFDNARKFITDCFIYPGGRPDNELQPPEKQVYGVTVFAEFDPDANVFKISTFSAGATTICRSSTGRPS
jgi:hypothetical protein